MKVKTKTNIVICVCGDNVTIPEGEILDVVEYVEKKYTDAGFVYNCIFLENKEYGFHLPLKEFSILTEEIK